MPLLATLLPRSPDGTRLADGSPKAGETDRTPSEGLFVQVGPRVRIRLAPAESPVRTIGKAWVGGAERWLEECRFAPGEGQVPAIPRFYDTFNVQSLLIYRPDT